MDVYLIKKATLTGIADAIREKVGSSDGIDPEQMEEMIKGIQSGGGGGGFSVNHVTPSETAYSLEVTHGLGKVPDHVVMVPDINGVVGATGKPLMIYSSAVGGIRVTASNDSSSSPSGANFYGYSKGWGINQDDLVIADNSKLTLTVPQATMCLPGGQTYMILCFCEK